MQSNEKLKASYKILLLHKFWKLDVHLDFSKDLITLKINKSPKADSSSHYIREVGVIFAE